MKTIRLSRGGRLSGLAARLPKKRKEEKKVRREKQEIHYHKTVHHDFRSQD
jgi:hypothetical protein